MLTYSDEVIHLGHVLSFDLNDGPDILRVLKDLNRKANCVLCTFNFADCYIKCFLIKLYCLFHYGCCIRSIDSKLLNSLQIALIRSCVKFGTFPHSLIFLLFFPPLVFLVYIALFTADS